ncbi:---NA--- [Octopus vulgaris]|uniref:---NA n=1 Tax=Octopus vulgaris TaxID=6645 RepID=A0AA36B7F2_OCTVU|nr:---NA--- [Octopus vulgaris]
MAVMVEGRKPRCLTCGKKEHIKKDCRPAEKEKKDEPIKPSSQVAVTETTPAPEEGEGLSQVAATKRKHNNPSPEKNKSREKREVKKAKKPDKENESAT